MVNYRRVYLKGGTYFFTVTLKNRQKNYLTTYIDALRESFAYAKKQKPFEIIAIVILPEHLHCIWQLPEDDNDYSGRWRSIKSHFTHSIIKTGLPLQKNNRGEYKLWQTRFWEHTIRDETDLSQHIHYNPVKHNLAQSVSEWPYSSFHDYVKDGKLPSNWGNVYIEQPNKYGEL